MAKKDERFIRTYDQSKISRAIEIWVDKETGVNYLYNTTGNSGGMCVLVNREGRPIVTTIFPEEG